MDSQKKSPNAKIQIQQKVIYNIDVAIAVLLHEDDVDTTHKTRQKFIKTVKRWNFDSIGCLLIILAFSYLIFLLKLEKINSIGKYMLEN
ncbi:hypothetical protein RDI58_007313 [Solanum bulbocastanum]|uniref:Uncharacterized protein n=1 Tax=Solanum bulbocastanum TaxID=147425 RepID=A0AAN8TUV9_SOLBU